MKKLVYLLAAGSMAFTACQNSPSYKIKGTVENIADGEVVYLQKYLNGDYQKVDSAIVGNGTFTFTGKQDTVAAHYITYSKEGKNRMINFFLENGEIHITLGDENKVSGTPNNDTYQKFRDEFAALSKEMNEMYQKAQTDSSLTKEQVEAIMAEIEKKDSVGMDMVYQTIEANITNPVGVYLLPSYAAAFDLDKQKALVEKVPAELANERINKLKAHIETCEKTAVGQQYIDFSMQTPEGETVNLSDFVSKNQYTLIDFWASWCGPCRKEMPHVVEAYKAFKNKGFGIVGVSLDNNADKWKEAIGTLNITWPQMSDLQGWNNAGAKLYGVNSIPATVLVDQNGTIVARGLRGNAIQEKLNELLK
ncbi:TlpA disulfide reductase family protein [Phocaeicola sp.]|uniref:TlpA disulfide reductase family protein n=1 Tax=Phocaeicola sp. TaxID=2773926 RepID=UPI0023C6EA12|nr:TlpA disulfide reductase family protein [Phocaeicola sp.]MDE5677556.1 AhpC/TSA family protein [Phocaeicola sp.]